MTLANLTPEMFGQLNEELFNSIKGSGKELFKKDDLDNLLKLMADFEVADNVFLQLVAEPTVETLEDHLFYAVLIGFNLATFLQKENEKECKNEVKWPNGRKF